MLWVLGAEFMINHTIKQGLGSTSFSRLDEDSSLTGGVGTALYRAPEQEAEVYVKNNVCIF
jgi:hypothetical protein